MSEANPYRTPGAELYAGEAAVYDPTIFSFSGRIGRIRYLAYSIGINLLLGAALFPLAVLLGFDSFGAGSSLAGLLPIGGLYAATFVIAIAYGKRRLNDLNRSGWWVLLMFVPIVNLLLAIYLVFFPGSADANDYGAPPAPNSTAVLILGWAMVILFVLGIAAAVLVPLATLS